METQKAIRLLVNSLLIPVLSPKAMCDIPSCCPYLTIVGLLETDILGAEVKRYDISVAENKAATKQYNIFVGKIATETSRNASFTEIRVSYRLRSRFFETSDIFGNQTK